MTVPTFTAPGATAPRMTDHYIPPTGGKYDDGEGPALEAGESAASDLTRLRDDLAAETKTDVLLPVPGRPLYSVRFRTDVSGDEIDRWRKSAKSKRHVDGVDSVKFAGLILANTCLEVMRDGVALTDADGDALTFRSVELWRGTLEASTAAGGVARFYGRDGHVNAASNTVLGESGWGEDLLPLDPTAGS